MKLVLAALIAIIVFCWFSRRREPIADDGWRELENVDYV